MTILPKKKQQTGGNHPPPQQQQPPPQDVRHQQHGAIDSTGGNNGVGGTSNLLTSSTIPSTVGPSAVSVSNAISNSSPISSFLSSNSAGAAMSSMQSPHHGGDVAAVPLGGGILGPGSCINSNAGTIRWPMPSSHMSCHDSSDSADGGAILLGPHRKRAAVGASSTSGAVGVGTSPSSRNSQNDRSSPYRTARRSNRGGAGGNGAIVASASPVSSNPSGSLAPTLNNVGVYNTGGTGPTTGAAAATGAVHNTRSNLSSPENRDDEGGYNSEDEYSYYGDKPAVVPDEVESKFEENLFATKGLQIKKMKEDGACLFRAVADQVYGDEEMHNVVRKLCMDYMAKNSDYFNQFVTEDFAAYVERKREDTAHGNHVEMQAMAEMFNRPIQVYQYACDPINTFHSPHETDNPAIRVSYHSNIHYNSVVDPYAATIGVGLGLPQFYPGLAEKNLMRDAEHASEKDAIEEAMLEDKLRATDWEATDEQLQEQVARESYLQWLRDQEKQMKENAATRDGASTTTMNPLSSGSQSPDSARPSCSKSLTRVQVGESGDSASASVAGSSRNRGGKRWDDEDDLLKQVLALSQQEYFDSFKTQRQDDSDGKKPSSSNAPS